MKLIATVERGGLIPGNHLGLYRYRYECDAGIYMLMPFNVLARWMYNGYIRVRCAFTPSLTFDAFQRGYKQGWEARQEAIEWARKDGYREGVEAGKKAAIDDLLQRVALLPP